MWFLFPVPCSHATKETDELDDGNQIRFSLPCSSEVPTKPPNSHTHTHTHTHAYTHTHTTMQQYYKLQINTQMSNLQKLYLHFKSLTQAQPSANLQKLQDPKIQTHTHHPKIQTHTHTHTHTHL